MNSARWMLLTALFAVVSVAQAQPTYSKEVARILQEKCQLCHAPNNIAPFTLTSFQDAHTWAEDIKRVVSEKIMPPWKPVEGHGEFRESYSLSNEERQTLVSWVNAGAPEGDPAELPEPRPQTGEWALGQPDLVVQMSEPYTPARGKDVYRCFVVSNPFEETAYVKAVDVIPGDRRIVHHVIMYIDERNQSEKLDAAEEGPGYTCFGGPKFDISFNSMLGGWAPGSIPRPLPEGIAVQIPRNARLVMQVHYYPVGRTSEDVTKVGLYLAKEQVRKRLYYFPVVNQSFEIPAGNADYEVKAELPSTLFDVKVIQVFPHMHKLGRQIRADATELNGATRPLIYISDWDFNWQGFYNYKEPVALSSTTKITVSCRFDNSENNPRNPNNPLKPVRWGEGTDDEMCITFFGATLDFENLR